MKAGALDLADIHREYRPMILRYLTRLVGAAEAEDVAQEVFAKVGAGLPGFRGGSALSTWIYRIARNCALDRLRSAESQRDRRTVPLEEGAEDAGGSGEKAPSIDREIFRKERLACYCRFVKKLPPNYRMIVVLSELEEMAAPEIADLLGLSLETVKIRLHRGRARLRRELKAHCRPEDWL